LKLKQKLKSPSFDTKYNIAMHQKCPLKSLKAFIFRAVIKMHPNQPTSLFQNVQACRHIESHMMTKSELEKKKKSKSKTINFEQISKLSG